MTAPLTPADLSKWRQGDAEPYRLTAAPIEKCIYCDLPSSKCLCAPDPRKRITAIPSKPYWLIERGQADGHTPTLWLREANAWKSGEPYLGMWTESAIEATRFETSSGAEYHIYKHSLHLCHVTEHLDLDAALTAAPIDGAAIPREPTPIMLMRGYQACDDFIGEHGDGDVAALDDGQFNDMLADAYRAMVSTHPPSREELAVALSAAPTVAPGDGAAGSNYVANSEHSPTEIWFANGRHVKIAGGCLIVDFENKP